MIWFAFFDEEEEPQMYDLLQLFELGPSVNREEKRKIKTFVVPPYAMLSVVSNQILHDAIS